VRDDGSLQCIDCEGWKPPEDFHRDRSKKSGRSTRCKGCSLARHRVYYQANRERLLAYVKAHVDPEQKRQYDCEHNQRNEVRAKRAEQRRAWAQANPEKAIPHNKDRSLRRRGHRLTGEARKYVTILLSDPCAYCGAPSEHIDHVDPINGGGLTVWDNLTPACRRCNYRKRDRPLLTFLLSITPTEQRKQRGGKSRC
jgi:hypothetical protein